jgi:hypothetical protein
MSENILFYLVFLSQIFLVSYYYPKEILERISYVIKTYPVDKYPKLYIKHPDYYQLGQTIFKIINYIILALGLLIIFAVGIWDSKSRGKVSEAIPAAYFFLQMVPMIMMEISGFAYFKLMRKTDIRTKRTADLQPRRFFDFVSPFALGLALIMFVACILFYHNLEPLRISVENDTFIILLTLLLTNILFAGIIFWNLYGKKRDPYQDGPDYKKQVKMTVKSLIYTSIVASAFLIINKAIDTYNLDFMQPVLMSAYLQFIIFIGLGAMLRNQNIEEMNFDVYKADTPVG